MKKCKFCGQIIETNAGLCPGCGANEFKSICANCGNEFEEGLYCPKCGIKIGQREKICPTCGNHYFTNACPNCGYSEWNSVAPQPVYTPVIPQYPTNTYAVPSKKSLWIEFFLCLFFGVYGAHKFYRRKPGMGLLYFFTAGLFLIGWIVDLIALAKKLCK